MPRARPSLPEWGARRDLLPGDPVGQFLLRDRGSWQVVIFAITLSALFNATALITISLGSLLSVDPARRYPLVISVFAYDFIVAPLVWAFYAWVSHAPWRS